MWEYHEKMEKNAIAVVWHGLKLRWPNYHSVSTQEYARSHSFEYQ